MALGGGVDFKSRPQVVLQQVCKQLTGGFPLQTGIGLKIGGCLLCNWGIRFQMDRDVILRWELRLRLGFHEA